MVHGLARKRSRLFQPDHGEREGVGNYLIVPAIVSLSLGSVELQSIACLILKIHRDSPLAVNSCCHILITCHPRFFKMRVTNRSRSLLWSSFFFQKARLVAGCDACFGQPCQKHPSTNTARRCTRKTKSGLPNSLSWRRQPMIRF